VGHIRPVFLMGQGGGKGVATAGGVFFGLAWIPTLIAVAAFLIILALTRIVSAGSLAAAVVLPASIAVMRGPKDYLFLICAVISAFVIWMHRANISRLARGTEPKVGRRPAEEAHP
jgi:glycerol-3-phosphate acyltransferase PlsY